MQPAVLTSKVFSQQIQPLLAGVQTSAIDHELVSPVGMRVRSDKGTARIRGIG
jgi:hypothetical protein